MRGAWIIRAAPLALLLAPQLAQVPVGAVDGGGPGRLCPAPRDGQIWVPGGETRIGDERAYPEEGPAYTADVKGFWMDRHEVTNSQFAAFVAATGYVTTAEMRGDGIVFAPPGRGEAPTRPDQWWRIVPGADWRHPTGPKDSLAGRDDYPVVQVSHADAAAYARWAGRALPSEEQFERAALGGGEAYLDQPDAIAANTWQGRFPVENKGEDGRKGLAPVGCYHANGYGLQDMIGNVWEWTESWYLPSHGALPVGLGAPGNPSFDPDQPNVRARVIKGGSFLCAANYCARYRPAARHAEDEASGASHLGFRTVDVRSSS